VDAETTNVPEIEIRADVSPWITLATKRCDVCSTSDLVMSNPLESDPEELTLLVSAEPKVLGDRVRKINRNSNRPSWSGPGAVCGAVAGWGEAGIGFQRQPSHPNLVPLFLYRKPRTAGRAAGGNGDGRHDSPLSTQGATWVTRGYSATMIDTRCYSAEHRK